MQQRALAHPSPVNEVTQGEEMMADQAAGHIRPHSPLQAVWTQ